ncbi:hypothetical protein LXL04_017345 [Taraxacum kok-saghyz]
MIQVTCVRSLKEIRYQFCTLEHKSNPAYLHMNGSSTTEGKGKVTRNERRRRTEDNLRRCRGTAGKSRIMSSEGAPGLSFTLLVRSIQQKKEVKELMAIISRIYPCKECADHFKEVLRSNPVEAGSQPEFSQWLCRTQSSANIRKHRHKSCTLIPRDVLPTTDVSTTQKTAKS